MTTLERLSRRRVVLRVTEPGSPAADGGETLIDLARLSGRCPVVLEPRGDGQGEAGGLPADGVVGVDDSPETCRPTFERILRRRREEGFTAPFEFWARVTPPDDREHWRRILREYEAAGATGILVPADPRLLDILRNPDEDDDRSDLVLTQG